MQTTTSTTRSTLNLRIKPEVRGLLDRAAAAQEKTLTDFVVDAARQAAVDALTERTLFSVDQDRFDAFVAALDAPPKPSAALCRTMQRRAGWEE